MGWVRGQKGKNPAVQRCGRAEGPLPPLPPPPAWAPTPRACGFVSCVLRLTQFTLYLVQRHGRRSEVRRGPSEGSLSALGGANPEEHTRDGRTTPSATLLRAGRGSAAAAQRLPHATMRDGWQTPPPAMPGLLTLPAGQHINRSSYLHVTQLCFKPCAVQNDVAGTCAPRSRGATALRVQPRRPHRCRTSDGQGTPRVQVRGVPACVAAASINSELMIGGTSMWHLP